MHTYLIRIKIFCMNRYKINIDHTGFLQMEYQLYADVELICMLL